MPRPPITARRLADVSAEAVLIAGGGRAILLQLADPAVGHAIARHSDFAADPLRRLRTTLTYVYALVYGTPAQVAAVRRMVNSAHAPVRSSKAPDGGVGAPAHDAPDDHAPAHDAPQDHAPDDAVPAHDAPDDGVPSYDARDPELQLWVAATLYDTAMLVRERLIGPLDDADLDAVYLDYAVLGTALQVPEGAWPTDRAAFQRYWDARLGELSVDDTVRRVARELLHPRSAPLWLRAAMPLGRLVTAGLLPARVRSAYRMPWSPARARRFAIAVTVMAVGNRMLPRRVREWPRNRLLRDLG